MTSKDVHRAASTGYSLAAETYADARPSFPAATVDWLLDALSMRPGDDLVEVGAGTGKFTALLVERGLRVVAIEPVAAMRAQLARLGSEVRVVDAVAEAMPLEEGSVRALIASQSLHWANVERAFAEFDRVLSTDGAIGLIWNFRDLSVAWQIELDELLSVLRGDAAPHSRDGRWQAALPSSAFEIAAEETWRWTMPTDASGVVNRVRSVSYVAALPEQEQQLVDTRVRELLAAHHLDRQELIEFPYVTEAYVLRSSVKRADRDASRCTS